MNTKQNDSTIRIKNHLKDHILAIRAGHPLLLEACSYALMHEGKRLRPLFLLSILDAFEIPFEKGLDAACALEMIHTYSLIHDDLPSMDNDDFRRGQPTVHKKFDEATAILVGDFLLTYAFEILSSSRVLTSEQKCELIFTLSKHAGAQGMIGGQMLDLKNTALDTDALEIIYEKKTAHLFICALWMGALISGASYEVILQLNSLGRSFGLAYQYFDDYHDFLIDNQKKELLCDQLSIFKEGFLRYHKKTLDELKKLPKSFSFLYDLIQFSFENHDLSLEYAKTQ